jgi:hypothetical protein
MLVAVIGVSAAAVAVLVLRRGTTLVPARPSPAGRPAELDGAVRHRSAPAAGNRAAVIRAYAGMEETLEEAHDLPRSSWEAPGEYLARAAPVLGRRGASARALTGLYQEARFSKHEVADAMRLEADAALADIRRAPGEDLP